MRTKTIVERGNGNEIMVMNADGEIRIARSIKGAKRIIHKADRDTAKIHGTVVNIIEWRGFSENEIA